MTLTFCTYATSNALCVKCCEETWMALIIPYQTGLKNRSLQFFNFPGTLSLKRRRTKKKLQHWTPWFSLRRAVWKYSTSTYLLRSKYEMFTDLLVEFSFSQDSDSPKSQLLLAFHENWNNCDLNVHLYNPEEKIWSLKLYLKINYHFNSLAKMWFLQCRDLVSTAPCWPPLAAAVNVVSASRCDGPACFSAWQ